MVEWQFEHFKTFTPYEIMQQAAATLLLFEGECTDGTNSKMRRLTDELKVNTGHPAWMPDRDSGNLNINNEGSVFRNKARLFSAFYICVPPDLAKKEGYGKKIILTEFGRALAEGRVKEKEFYSFIVKTFRYPHLAYSNYNEWIKNGILIRPLLIIIKTLVYLFEKAGNTESYITAEEVYLYLQCLKNEDCNCAVIKILKARRQCKTGDLNKDILRKIHEMLAFLAIGGYVYIDSTTEKTDRFWLNLIMRHPKEKTYFYLQRSAGGAGTGTSKEKINIIEIYKNLWE